LFAIPGNVDKSVWCKL